jgi:hypothetical protein
MTKLRYAAKPRGKKRVGSLSLLSACRGGEEKGSGEEKRRKGVERRKGVGEEKGSGEEKGRRKGVGSLFSSFGDDCLAKADRSQDRLKKTPDPFSSRRGLRDGAVLR